MDASRPHPELRGRAGAAIAVVVAAAAATSCSGDHNALAPRGPEAARVSILGWGMIAVATAITVVVFALLVAAILPGDRRRLRSIPSRTYVIVGGVAMPLVVLLTLSGFTVAAMDATDTDGTTAIEVVGHQFWWEVRYPGTDAVTANEIHVPAGEPVRLTLRSDDVIHSFWVPALAGKVDMIPGRTNHLTIEADEPGTYRGQCAEYCGLQHARMAFVVIAETPDDYRAWLAGQARPAQPAAGTEAGARAFASQSCAGCHTIRGSDATGDRGPDLTHLASRQTLGALTIPNDRSHLARWIVDAPAFKEGVAMPPIVLSPTEQTAIVDYLQGLR
jgi:cytochrome c oxidase subunit 2